TNALGGADQLTVNNLAGTDLTEVKTDLAGSLGGTTGDGSADQVIVNGTNGADAITAAGSAGNVSVTGLAARVDVTHAQVAQDVLAINALAGDDVVDGSGLAADAIQFHADGGDGNDVLIGGEALFDGGLEPPNGGVRRLEPALAFARQKDLEDAAVGGVGMALDQPSPFQRHEHAVHGLRGGVAGPREVRARGTGFTREHAQYPVLPRGQAVRVQAHFHSAVEATPRLA